MLHVQTPSGYLLNPKGRRASIRVNRHYKLLQLIDFTNHMVPSPDDPNFFVPHHDIPPIQRKARHYRMGLVSQEKLSKIIEDHRQSGAIDQRICHTVSFDTPEDGLFRAFETRYATDVLVSHEVDDVKALTKDDKAFYMDVVNEFVLVYRYVSGDYRPRLLQDCREPMALDSGTLEYDVSELETPLDDRLRAARELKFQEHQDKAVYDRQPYSETPANEVSRMLERFFADNKGITPGEEFLAMAQHAALQTKNSKYAVLEAFISAETVIVEFLGAKKLAKGVSRKKMKDWEQEVGVGYMLNIELPLIIENMTREDRETLGEVDRVRRMRNDIVHDGKRPTEGEAQFAVKAVGKLHETLRRWAANE
jgi:hypothetical protein